MGIGGIILGALAAAALLFTSNWPRPRNDQASAIYGPPEKDGNTKAEPPKDNKPSR